MKYSEFRKLMENKGFEVYKGRAETLVHDKNEKVISMISNVDSAVLRLTWASYRKLPKKLRRFIAQKSMELAFTDLEDREDEDEYYLRQIGINPGLSFLNKYVKTENGRFIVSTRLEDDSHKTKFTQKEIDELPECYTHPAVWEKIKVEREEK